MKGKNTTQLKEHGGDVERVECHCWFLLYLNDSQKEL